MDCDRCGRWVEWYEIDDEVGYGDRMLYPVESVLCAECAGGRVQVNTAEGTHIE